MASGAGEGGQGIKVYHGAVPRVGADLHILGQEGLCDAALLAPGSSDAL